MYESVKYFIAYIVNKNSLNFTIATEKKNIWAVVFGSEKKNNHGSNYMIMIESKNIWADVFGSNYVIMIESKNIWTVMFGKDTPAQKWQN